MPSRNEIQNEVQKRQTAAVDEIRRKYFKKLADYTKRDTILYASAFTSHKRPDIPRVLMSVNLEDIQGFMSALHGLRRKKLDLIIHSPGGSMETAEQIVRYLRSKYNHIRAIIPQNAMSAATMIACASDEIIMGKHSALGPIDPQLIFTTPNGSSFASPAQSILEEFEQAKKEVKEDPKTAPLWVSKVENYPYGLLDECKKTIELAIEKVREWLNSYMFHGLPAEEKLGERIANWLGNAQYHKTHARPITIEKADEIGLKVTALEEDNDLQENVLSVFHAAMITFGMTNCVKMVENHNGKGLFHRIELKVIPQMQQ